MAELPSSSLTATDGALPTVACRVSNRGFEPATLRVRPGQLVRFTVTGSVSHILHGPGLPATPLLRPGDSFEFAFSESGALGDEVLSFVRGVVEVATLASAPASAADDDDRVTATSTEAHSPCGGAPSDAGVNAEAEVGTASPSCS